MRDFWKVLFEPEEHTCFSLDAYGTRLSTVNQIPQARYFSINPMMPGTSRRDDNVICLRNMLIEFDESSVAEQEKLLQNIPYSTLVWSGGKSYHAIISLEEPCLNRKEYDALIRHICAIFPMADKKVKNPSRFSRVPGAIRDNGNLQRLVDVKTRVNRISISDWLGPLPERLKTKRPKLVSLGISPWTRNFLMFGAAKGGRSNALFAAACDMFRHGYDAESIADLARNAVDLTEREFQSCIRSAEQAVRREGV